MLNFFCRRISCPVAAFPDEATLDEIVFAVDDAAETPRPLPVNVHVFVREDGAALNDSEMQFLVNEIILAEKIFGVVLVVQIIDVFHELKPFRHDKCFSQSSGNL